MTSGPIVLLTGAAGFVGRSVASRLHGQATVVGLDIAPQPASWPGRWIQSSTETALQNPELMQGVDIVVHAAWTGFPGAIAAAELDFARNVGPTLQLYRQACDAKVSQFVFLSSGGTVYGDHGSAPIVEGVDLHPISQYGASKAATENSLREVSADAGPPVTILRLSNPYGPGQRPWRGQGLIATAIACCLTATKFSAWGDGRSIRDYLYIDDAAAGIVAATQNPLTKGETLNVGSGLGLTLDQILTEVQNATGFNLNIERLPARQVDVAANILSIDKISRMCGWAPEYDFATGIRRFVEWMRHNRSSWIDSVPGGPVVSDGPTRSRVVV